MEIMDNVAAGYGGSQQYEPQQGIDPSNTITVLDLIGQDFTGTKAASFSSLEDLAKSYNNLASLMGSKIENLSPEQRATLSNMFGERAADVPRSASDYKIATENPDIAKALQNAAYDMGLSQQQADRVTELIGEFSDSLVQNFENEMQETAMGYVDQSRQVFGQSLDNIIATSEYVAENIIPHVCGMDGDSFLYLLGAHGLAGHPAILSLLSHIGELYQQGRGNIPAGTYANGGNDLGFYNTPEAQRILADKTHARHKEYHQGLMDAASRRRK